MEEFIDRFHNHRRVITVLAVLVIITTAVFSKMNIAITATMCGFVIAFQLIYEIIRKYVDEQRSSMFGFFIFLEIVISNMIETFMLDNLYCFIVFVLLTLILNFEYLLYGTDYDTNGQGLKKFVLLCPLVVNVSKVSLSEAAGNYWVAYTVLQILIFLIICYYADFFVETNEAHRLEKNKLKLDISNIERDNETLIEYHNRIQVINEQINFQRIELSRANKNLEQANVEMESQTELMKYMASTFNVFKCMNVIAEAVMEVKKAKVCALYVESDVFMNKYPSSIIKTNYTSMEQRLNKDIKKIYENYGKGKRESAIYTGDALSDFKFIGDANIESIAIFPICNAEEAYGIMIIGSNKADYFDKGLTYFETTLAEFNISVKSTILYLQTQDMARKDGLTGIYNRVYFKELYSEITKNSIDNNTPISVALFDIDKFKTVNDTYGHLAGDEVIKMVAKTAEKYAEMHNGYAIRYGGEEFLLVLPDKDENETLPILEEMHQNIKSNNVVYNGIEISVNVCIGLSSYPSLCYNTDLLVGRADKAMYYGKKNGRGRLIVDNPSLYED